MGLRFFADQCVPTVVIETLRITRFSCHFKGTRTGMILISLNGDFANISNYPPNNYQGIVALQVRNHPEVLPQIVSRLKDYLSANPVTQVMK